MAKILVIEDDADVRENIMELLTAEGYQVLEAEDGANGIRAAWDNSPDLIICDITMPRLDGFETLLLLARDERTQSIPFIFLTARTSRDDQRRGMSMGADDYITKPFTRSELLGAIQARLARRANLDGHAQRRLDSLERTSSVLLPRPLLNHLSVILGFSELLERDYHSLERGQVMEIARDIKHSANQLLRWVQNRMLYMELVRDWHGAEPIPGGNTVSAHRVIEEAALERARTFLRSADLEINLEPVSIAVSDIFLKKIVEEALDNALRYSLPETTVKVNGVTQGDFYRLEMTDRGRGMPPEQAAAAGQPLPAGVEEVVRGSYGLGLQIVRGLVVRHGGSFEARSAFGEGTTLVITLPCARSEPLSDEQG